MTRHFDVLARGSRSKSAQGRLLRLEFLEPRWTLGVSAAANFLGLIDPTMAKLVKSLCADGSISRADMIRVLQTVQREPDGVVDATNLSDLRTIVKNAAKLKMANYVTVLASDTAGVINVTDNLVIGVGQRFLDWFLPGRDVNTDLEHVDAGER